MKLTSLSIKNVPFTKTKQLFFSREKVASEYKTMKFHIFL